MNQKLIITENYLLLLGDIEKNNLNVYVYAGDEIPENPIFKTDKLYFDHYIEFPKIIGHLPFNNAPELENVALLPDLDTSWDQLGTDAMNCYIREKHDLDRCMGFIDGFNKAKETYKYTEQDLIDAVMLGVCFESNGIVGITNSNELQDLAKKRANISKYPIAFECNVLLNIHCDRAANGFEQILETTTNSEGKKVLTGTYIWK